MMVDKEGTNRVEGKEAAEFLRKSGLPKDVLRAIWLISAKSDPGYLEKDEFYVALRLIALAQNNMEVSEESIRLNHPIPPTPKFNFRNANPEPQPEILSKISNKFTFKNNRKSRT